MEIGIIGQKYTGKTTLFNVITGAAQPVGQGGVEPHRGIGKVPDPRLKQLSAIYRPRRTVPAQIAWVDVPGFRPGESTDGGREATRFLEHARRVDALAQVVRCFDGGHGMPNPAGELATLALELIIADLQVVENRLERLQRERRIKGKAASTVEPDLMERLRGHLEAERPLREIELSVDERKLVSGFSFLTLKPLIVVLNHGEGEPPSATVLETATEAGAEVVALCASVEAELAELTDEEAQEFLATLGVEEPAAHRMIRAAYGALDLQSFFTVGEDECRAWTIRRGSRAPAAAGAIHSDLERGFIRAEVYQFSDLVAAGSHTAAKAAGKMGLEGKAYEVRDGDILEIRFSV